ncbi:MAG: DUF5989 family protein [Verrucomicrobiota bacterium]|nr:DUF5989 family protein [Verrucomicrobiota bacterium]
MPKPEKKFSEAAPQSQGGLISEFWSFLKHNKKFWMIPLLIILLLFGILIVIGGSAAAPFIYPLF